MAMVFFNFTVKYPATIILRDGGELRYEDDISAEEETESQGSWLPFQNEHKRRQKSSCCKKSKRQKEDFSLKQAAGL